MIYLVFYKTNDVFVSEELLNGAGIEVTIVPTPVQDIAYCGVCNKIDSKYEKIATTILGSMDYIIIRS